MHYIETSQLVCHENQLPSIYMMWKIILIELNCLSVKIVLYLFTVFLIFHDFGVKFLSSFRYVLQLIRCFQIIILKCILRRSVTALINY